MTYIMAQKNDFIFGDTERDILGCINNGLTEEQARAVFDVMESAGSYCFNKSHGLSYSLLTYYTAYLKCHHPLEFMGTLLSLTSDNTKITQYLTQCKDLNVKVINPDINNSELGFKIHNGAILYGIGSLNNVGEPTVKQLIKNRPYTSFQDFLNKNVQNILEEDGKFDKSALISLVNSGCFDSLPMNDEDSEIPSRDFLLGKIFYNNIAMITKVSTSNIEEIFDNSLIDILQFSKEKEIYDLHKILLSKKNKLDLINDDNIVVKIKNNYSEDVYEQVDNELLITKKYKKEYEKHLSKLKEDFKINSTDYTTQINKLRVVTAYMGYKGNKDVADLEFESTSYYFQSSWLQKSIEKYGVDEFNDIPSLDMAEVGYYKKKQLYTIVGTLTGKVKVHKEIILLTNSGIVIAKLGDVLYNTVASDLSRGDKLALSGFVGDGFFRCEYYENGKSNKLKSLKVLE